MNDDDLSPSSFTKEKSLWAVYKQARRIPTNRFNAVTTVLVFVACFVTCWLSPQDISDTVRFVREIATLGFNASLTVLGFLVAGFTIFATISNPNMLVRMGIMRHPESGLSWLKHTFFVLIRVFIYYLVYTVLCFLVIIFGVKNGLVSVLIEFSPNPVSIKFLVAKIIFVILISGQYFLLMQLKSFIYNVYHSVMAALRWKAEGHD
jgi:hypothetical protein